MRCPNCERVVSLSDLRCRVCHQRLTIWYVLTIFFAAVMLAAILLLLEQI